MLTSMPWEQANFKQEVAVPISSTFSAAAKATIHNSGRKFFCEQTALCCQTPMSHDMLGGKELLRAMGANRLKYRPPLARWYSIEPYLILNWFLCFMAQSKKSGGSRTELELFNIRATSFAASSHVGGGRRRQTTSRSKSRRRSRTNGGVNFCDGWVRIQSAGRFDSV
jgi:hypothetical protein